MALPPSDPGGSASSDRGLPLEIIDPDAGSALGWDSDEDYAFDVVQPTETTTTTTAKTANLWSRLVSEESLRKLVRLRKILSRWRKFGAIAMVIMYSRTKGGRVLNWCRHFSVLTRHLKDKTGYPLTLGGDGLWPWPGF